MVNMQEAIRKIITGQTELRKIVCHSLDFHWFFRVVAACAFNVGITCAFSTVLKVWQYISVF